MDNQRLYRVTGTVCTSISVDCVVMVSTREDILEKARECLNEKYNKKDCIVDKIIEISKCEGCQYESLGQKPHMEHPYGCLHISSNCDMCEMELKNLMKLSRPNNKNAQTTKSSTNV